MTATKASLGVGDSVQLTVQRKVAWLRTVELPDPTQIRYATTSESTLIVESDGRATCVGTNGRPRESAWISATYGESHGHLSFDLKGDGPGPTLELSPAPGPLPPLPDNARSPFVPCCAPPLALEEGQEMGFTVRARAAGRDVTSAATGTRYTLFVGSGTPNDRRPSIITGGPEAVSALTVRLAQTRGAITAPDSIGRQNFARVIAFFRNGALVGWREIVIVRR